MIPLLSTLTSNQLEFYINKQAWLESLADIEYQMYYEKIGYADFWAKYLWGEVTPENVTLLA
jgi:uncharacterized protein with von Willebrand factor type A (vWA) domain